MTVDANAVLMGGAGAPTWKFDDEGSRKVGTIAAPPQARQEREYDPNNAGGGAPKFFPSGDPIMGIYVEVQTDERDPSRDGDDGRRTFYIEGKRLKEAVKAAVRAAGCAGLEVGAVLDVTLTRYDEPGDRRSGRNWHIVYTPAGNAALMGGTPTPAVAPTPAPAAPRYQAPAPVQQPAPQAPAPVPQAPAPAPAPAPAAQQPTPEQMAAFMAYQQQLQNQQQAG